MPNRHRPWEISARPPQSSSQGESHKPQQTTIVSVPASSKRVNSAWVRHLLTFLLAAGMFAAGVYFDSTPVLLLGAFLTGFFLRGLE